MHFTQRSVYTNQVVTEWERPKPVREEAITTTENPMWMNYGRGRRYYNDALGKALRNVDMGNNFTLTRTVRECNHPSLSLDRKTATVNASFTGPAGLNLSTQSATTVALQGAYWPSLDEVEAVLFASGGTAISRTLPTKSQSQLALSLIELVREGIPALIGASLVRGGINPRTLAEEYLNYEFGWAPLIRDVQSLMRVVSESASILEEYRLHAGKHTRRRYQFPDVKETRMFTGATRVASDIPLANLMSGVGNGYPQVIQSLSQRTWFSGAYRYYLPVTEPSFEDFRAWEREANHLLGLRLTPELLWNATPWTWLADWFANIGDVVSNVSHIGQDGLVLQYGYIMQETHVRSEVYLPGATPYGVSGPLGETITVSRKVRRKASPYGFGLTAEALTPKQWAILGALGLTQAPGRHRT
jgi:hypothetical protein